MRVRDWKDVFEERVVETARYIEEHKATERDGKGLWDMQGHSVYGCNECEWLVVEGGVISEV